MFSLLSRFTTVCFLILSAPVQSLVVSDDVFALFLKSIDLMFLSPASVDFLGRLVNPLPVVKDSG